MAENKVIVDADVDAADLHLVIPPEVESEAEFSGMGLAVIDPERCTECGDCRERCRFGAISENFVVDRMACEGCGVCVHFCPVAAIDFPARICGRWYLSNTRHGRMVHARLGIAEENSGLLVTLLRNEAKKLAEAESKELILIDGPPGIGCPVIASITGASAVLVVTEPTLSGIHDLERVNQLAAFLKVPAMVCVNKADINPEMAARIKAYAESSNMTYMGEIPYDKEVTAAMVAQKTLVDHSDGPAATAVTAVWQNVREFMDTV